MPIRFIGSICVSVSKLVAIGAEIWSLFWFFFKIATVPHLAFFEVGNFTCRTSSEGQYGSLCQILCRWSNRCRDMTIFQDGGCLPSWVLKVANFKWWTCSEGHCASRAEFCADWSNRCRVMAIFRFCKMAPVGHLGFLNVGNFNCRYPLEDQCASPCQILYCLVKPLQNCGNFWFFNIADHRLSRIFKVENFNCWYRLEGQYGGRPLSWIYFTCVWTTHEA